MTTRSEGGKQSGPTMAKEFAKVAAHLSEPSAAPILSQHGRIHDLHLQDLYALIEAHTCFNAQFEN